MRALRLFVWRTRFWVWLFRAPFRLALHGAIVPPPEPPADAFDWFGRDRYKTQWQHTAARMERLARIVRSANLDE